MRLTPSQRRVVYALHTVGAPSSIRTIVDRLDDATYATTANHLYAAAKAGAVEKVGTESSGGGRPAVTWQPTEAGLVAIGALDDDDIREPRCARSAALAGDTLDDCDDDDVAQIVTGARLITTARTPLGAVAQVRAAQRLRASVLVLRSRVRRQSRVPWSSLEQLVDAADQWVQVGGGRAAA